MTIDPKILLTNLSIIGLSKYDRENLKEYLSRIDSFFAPEYKEYCNMYGLRTLLYNHKFSTYQLEYLFKQCCKFGYMKMARHINSFETINPHIDNDEPLILACSNGHLLLAKWLYHVVYEYECIFTSVYRNRLDNAYTLSMLNGHTEVSKWLYEIIYSDDEYTFIVDYKGMFKNACKNNYLDMAKWIDSIQTVSYTILNESLIIASVHGNVEIVDCIINDLIDEDNDESIDLGYMNYKAFRKACFKGHQNVAMILYYSMSIEKKTNLSKLFDEIIKKIDDIKDFNEFDEFDEFDDNFDINGINDVRVWLVELNEEIKLNGIDE